MARCDEPIRLLEEVLEEETREAYRVVKIKVTGGTVSGNASSLCATCRHAAIVQGPALDDRIMHCDQLCGSKAILRFPVKQCTMYSDRRMPSLREMEEIAWVLRTDGKASKIGFVRAKDLKPSERHTLHEHYDD